MSRLAADQHGVVGRAQLRALGFGPSRIAHGIRTGRLHRELRGVFAVGHRRLTWEGRCHAAILACGGRSALGYRSAGTHWALRPWSAPRIEVVVASTSRPTHEGVAVHRHPGMRPDEVTVHRGLRVTTVARTLLDLGVVLAPSGLRTAVAQGEGLGLFDLWELQTLIERHPGHPGAHRVRVVLGSWEAPPRVRSPQEESFPDLCRRLGLPAPVMNATILGMEIDASFPDHGVAVELDSWRFHRGVITWEDDHEKRARLVAGGWVALAYTYRQQRERDGLFVLETLGPALGRGRPTVPRPLRG